MPKIEEPTTPTKPATKTVIVTKRETPVLAFVPDTREVKYPEFWVRCFFDGEWLAGSDENGNPVRLTGEGPLTAEQAMVLLDWIDEDTHNKFMQTINPEAIGKDGQVVVYKYDGPSGVDSLFTDRNGKKVRCNNVVGNRWFDERYTKGYMQTLLKKVWAGPIAFPGETVNGETLIITRTGRVDSGQKRLVALCWAQQELDKDDYWRQWWPDGIVKMDCIIAFGVSEDPRVTRTLDQVQPRSEADQLYTGPAFRDLAKNDKRLVSRIAQTTIDLLWSRSWDGSKENTREPIRTGIAAMGFWDRHPKIQDCVRHIFDVDYKESYLQTLKLHRGLCAAAMYLMAASATDRDAYVPTDGIPPDESKIDWQHLDTAKEFWSDAAKAEFDCLKVALKELVNPNDPSQTGSVEQKLAVLALAWERYLGGTADIDESATRTKKELELTPEELRNNRTLQARRRAVNTWKEVDGTISPDTAPYSLKEYYTQEGEKFIPKGFPTFGGIDLGKPDPEASKNPTIKEIEERKKTERDAEVERIVKSSVVTMPVATGVHEMEEQLEAIHQRLPGRVVIFTDIPDKDSQGKLITTTRMAQAWKDDARKVCMILGSDAPAKLDTDKNLRVRFPMMKLTGFLTRLVAAGQKCAVAQRDEDKLVIHDWNPPAPTENGQKPEPATDEPKSLPNIHPRKSPTTISGQPTRTAVNAEQTRKAAEADKQMAEEKAKPKSKVLPTKKTKPVLRGGTN